LAPLQLGAGVPLATEAIARASVIMFNNHRRDSNFVQLDVDVANAFNEIDRSKFLEQVRLRLPGLARFAYATYAQSSFLFYGDFVLISSQGSQQGDPLGGLFFALGLHPVVTRVSAEVDLLLHVWYFDDGRLDGRVSEVHRAWDILRVDLPTIGLIPKLAKCKVAFSEAYEQRRPEDAMDIDEGGIPSDSFPVEMERVMRVDREKVQRGFVTMGTPVGTKEFVDKFFNLKLERIRTLHRRISNLRRLQTQLWILRICASVCKIMYWMRIMDPETIMPHLREFDRMQFRLLQEIAGVDFDDMDMIQAALPLSRGGLAGMRSAEAHSSAAFLAGSKSSAALVKDLIGEEPVDPNAVVNALAVYNAKVTVTARMDVAKLGAMESIEQKSLSIAIDNFAESRLVSMIEQETDIDVKNLHLDRLFSIKTEASTAWLLAFPIPSLASR
jgi:hypothetical protein